MKSMESIYTLTPISKFSGLSRRKGSQKNRDRNPVLVPAVSEIKQRVSSARLLRIKQLQNQIGEAHHRVAVSCFVVIYYLKLKSFIYFEGVNCGKSPSKIVAQKTRFGFNQVRKL
jgi:hypothetical protein